MALSVRILIGLLLGLAGGAIYAAVGGSASGPAVDVAGTVGGLWLNALRMTIVPLVFSLLVVGVVKSRNRAGRKGLASRSVAVYLVLLTIGAFLGAAYTVGALALFPIPGGVTEALGEDLSGIGDAVMMPPLSQILIDVIPTNPIAAAAEGAMLPLVIFAGFLAFALCALDEPRRATLFNIFDATAEAMLVIVRWVLIAGPVGVAALGFAVGARSGLAMTGALAHYVLMMMSGGLLVVALGYAVALTARKTSIAAFARHALSAQAVALGTQSSIAALPAMLAGADRMGVRRGVSRVTLPLAVSIFRISGPWSSIAVAVYAASLYGIEASAMTLALACLVAVGMDFASAGLPNQVNVFTVYTPVFAVMGVPIEILALLIAVETAPDAVNTAGNVTMDLGVTAALNDRFHAQGASDPAE